MGGTNLYYIKYVLKRESNKLRNFRQKFCYLTILDVTHYFANQCLLLE